MAFPGFDLNDKVMLVTGAGKGIGRGIAIAAAQMGADVLLNSRTRSDLEEVAEEIRAAGGKAEPVVFDASKMDEIARGSQEAIDVWGRVDVLVNNAGTNRPKPALEVTEDDWDTVYDLNLKGLFFLTQRLVKPMIERESGKIINITSTMALVGRGPADNLFRQQGWGCGIDKRPRGRVGTSQRNGEYGCSGIHANTACE